MYKITVNGRVEYQDFGLVEFLDALKAEARSPRNQIKAHIYADGKWTELDVRTLLYTDK